MFCFFLQQNIILKWFNQRTSGLVNAHMTPVPQIYFNAFIHVYSPRAGADNPLGTNVDVNRKPLPLCPFVASFKIISLKYDFKHILNDFIHVYSPRAGTDKPLGTKFLISLPICSKNFITTERSFLLAHLLQVSKWSLQNLIVYTFLMILYMYIAPGQGQKTPWGKTFDVNRKPLSLRPFVASSKQVSLNSDFIHIL